MKDLYRTAKATYKVFRFALAAMDGALTVASGESTGKALGYMSMKTGTKLLGKYGYVGALIRVGYGAIKAGQEYQESGSLIDSTVAFVKSTASGPSLRRAEVKDSDTLAVQLEFAVQPDDSANFLQRLRKDSILGPEYDWDNNHFGFFNESSAVLEVCEPVEGQPEGTYKCTSEEIGVRVYTYITVSVSGSVPLTWTEYSEYSTTFYNNVRAAVAVMGGRTLNENKVVLEWSNANHVISNTDSSKGVKVADKLTYRLEVDNRALRDKMKADVTPTILNKSLQKSRRGGTFYEVIVDSVSFSDSRPSQPAAGTGTTVSKTDMESSSVLSAASAAHTKSLCVTLLFVFASLVSTELYSSRH